MNIRKTLSILLGGLCALGSAHAAPEWPGKAIRVVVPFAVGSFTDTAARVVGSELSKQLGQPVIVENRGGAGSTIGTELVARAEPDGYTFLVTDNSFPISAALYPKLSYDAARDFAPVSLLAESPAILLARANFPEKTLGATLDLARSQPGKLTFGSGGAGSSAHLAMELLMLQANVKLTHVPYKGVAAALVDIAAGTIDLGFSSVGSATPHINSGRVQALALSGAKRHPALPDVPTFGEAGFKDFSMTYRFGVLAPAGTPAPIIKRMQENIATALNNKQVQDTFAAAGASAVSSTPEQYGKMLSDEQGMWKAVIQQAGIKLE